MTSKLKTLREKAGLSQSQFAALTDTPLATVQAYEQGKRSIGGAKFDKLTKFAEVLKCDITELVEE